MRRALILLALAACVLCGCKKDKVEEETISLFFSYERLSPLMYKFTNESVGYSDFKWEFGDGSFSLGYNALKTFAACGTYTVTLTGEHAGKKQSLRQNIRVTTPAIYIAGYTLYHIPYDNRYYKLVVKDDNLLPSSWDFQTPYTEMLETADLPYTVTFTNPRAFENPETHEYYTVEVLRNTTKNAGSDVSCMKQQLKVSEIMEYQPEYVLQTETGNTAVGIIMEYRY